MRAMSGRPRTLFLHIGAPKTGTTALQVALSNGRKKLADVGFHYLDGDRNHTERMSLAFWAPEDAARLACLRRFDDPGFSQEAVLDALEMEISEAAPRDLIVSAEGISDFTAEDVDRLYRFFTAHVDEVRVIAYVREPQSWMISACQQAVKWSGAHLHDLFQAPRLPRYIARFEPHLKAVGRRRFDLRVYGGAGFDVVSDFTRAIGAPELPVADKRENAALSHVASVMLSAANERLPPFVNCRANPFRAFRFVDACTLPGRAFDLPRETVDWASEALNEDRNWVNQLLGHPVFECPELPDISIDGWFDEDRLRNESKALDLLTMSASAQNEQALKAFLRSRRAQGDEAENLLQTAATLTTDRWTLGQIAEAAVAITHPNRRQFFAKQRLMRRIEEPGPEDPPLAIGNPFDRFWREDLREFYVKHAV